MNMELQARKKRKSNKEAMLWKHLSDSWNIHILQFSSVVQSSPILCDLIHYSVPGFPVHHQLLELAQTHVSDAIQQSHPLSSPSPPAFNLSQHQGLFQWVSFSSLSVQFSHSVMSDSLPPHESQHVRPPCPSPTPGVHSNSRPTNQWCHPAISSSVIPFSSCTQSLPASEFFPMSQLFTWGGQSNDRMISVRFQGKPFNITILQVYSPTSNTEEAELEHSVKTYKTF